jgi:hypothetical protein
VARRRAAAADPLRRALAGLLIAALVLLLVEGAARLLLPPPGGAKAAVAGLMAPDPRLGWRLRPGSWASPGRDGPVTVEIGEDGLRACPAAAGPLILTLGDSSVFGHGLVEADTLHAQLGAALAARGQPARVCTAAVPGYSALQTLAALEGGLWDRRPAALVLAQLWSDNNHDHFEDAALLAALGQPEGQLSLLLSRSRAALGLRRLLGRPDHRTVGWQLPGLTEGLRRVPLPAYAAALRALLDGARARGIGVVVLTLANRETVGAPEAPGPWDPYVQVQAATATAAGLPRIDASAALRALNLPLDALFLDQMHPTGRANAAVAAALAPALAAGAPVPAAFDPVETPPDPWERGPVEPRSLQVRAVEGAP